MRKRIFLIVAALFVFTAVATADGPSDILAVGGESLFDLSSPYGLTYASSVVGGGVFLAGPTSITVNPALTAYEQRVGLNVGYTALVKPGIAGSFGSALQLGILIPFKWAIFTGYLNGTFPGGTIPSSEPYYVSIGNSINLKAGLSKAITDNLSVGLGLNTGVAWGAFTDWGLSANLGFVYNLREVGFLKDFRYGVSILNLGKNYAATSYQKYVRNYPCIATVKMGAGANLVSNSVIKLGASIDLTVPCFINLIVDAGLQFVIKDMLTLSVAEKINLLESIKGVNNYIPSVGLFFRFTFDVKNNAYLKQHDWNESEMTPSVAYKNMYENTHAISVGVDVLLGLKDETPPVITIMFDDDEEE